jgi:cysteine desulfurase/selenocysteine lyase
MFSARARKYLRRPCDTGFLYLRREPSERSNRPSSISRPPLSRHRHLRRPRRRAPVLETWERSVAGQIGLGVAARYAMRMGIDAIEARVKTLGALLRQALAKQPGVSVRDLGVEQCGIVSFLEGGEPPRQTRDRLLAMKINVHVSRSPRTPAFDLPARGLDALVRTRVHYYKRRAGGGALPSGPGGLDTFSAA